MCLIFYPQSYLIVVFTYFKLCLHDRIHNINPVKIMQIWYTNAWQLDLL